MKKNVKKPLIAGIVGGLVLLVVYFGILTVANSFSHAVEQFVEMWYWILILVIGFGVQLGFYSHIRTSMRTKTTIATAEVATAGGVSTGSMIACCAHHVTDVLPIIGLSAAAIFLTEYQLFFIVLGVLSNIVGIFMMLGIIQKHGLYEKRGFLNNLLKFNMKTFRNITIILSIIILIIFFGITNFTESITTSQKSFNLPTRSNDENGVSLEVTPENFSFNEPIKFYIAINTHRGSLYFDLTKISVLKDDNGNVYTPLDWEGSPSGGHHRYGTLSFPELEKETESISLVIKNVYEVPERIFMWNLN